MSIQLGPKWLELLPGFKVQVRPVSRIMARAASLAMTAAIDAAKLAGQDDALAEETGDDAYNRSLARDAILDWGGDVIGTDGAPAMVTPENIDLLMDQAVPARAFNNLYISPYIAEVLEKNGLSPSSTGNMPRTAADTAADAQSQPGSDTAMAPPPGTDSPQNSAPS